MNAASEKESTTELLLQQSEERNNLLRVLLVDDQLIIAEGIKRMLSQEKDIEFFYCPDPSQAITMTIENKITVVLLDLVMPDISGITLAKYFRANKQTRDIPIIVMSSNEDPVTKRDAFSSGASDYLVKLPDQIELIARIRAHSKRYMLQIERDQAFIELYKIKRKLEESNEALHKLSSLDGLTQIANRRTFDKTLSNEWNRAMREKRELSMLLIDIDYFKRYNDSYGHLAGDEALIKIAQTLNNVTNRPGDIFCRYGGEEFAAILPSTDLKGAELVAQKFHDAIRTLNIPHPKSDVSDIITISIGCATITPNIKLEKTLLISIADRALYAAKNSGRNRSSSSDQL